MSRIDKVAPGLWLALVIAAGTVAAAAGATAGAVSGLLVDEKNEALRRRGEQDPSSSTDIDIPRDQGDAEGYFPTAADELRYVPHLEAMGEPSMLRMAKTVTVESYRLLWLRSFHRPVAVRVELHAVVPPAVTVKVLDGMGVEPGKLVLSTERALAPREVDALRRALVQHEFWELPRGRELKSVDEQGREYITVCSDGAQWVLEAAVRGRYHLVDWHCLSAGDAPRTLGEHLLGLSGLRFEEVY